MPDATTPDAGPPDLAQSDATTPDSPVRRPWIAVSEVMSAPGITLSAGASLWQAIDAVVRGDADRIWVTAPDGRLAGEVTGEALLRAEVRGVPGERPLSMLSQPVAPLDETADAGAAVARMGAGERLIPITREGVLVGELTLNDALELVNGVRRVAEVADVETNAEEASAESSSAAKPIGPAAPHFLHRRARRRTYRRRA